MTTPLASLPATQNIAAASGTLYLGANANPTDANADFIYHPSGAGKYFVFDTTSTQPLVIRQVGGVAGTNEIQMWEDGTNGNILCKQRLRLMSPDGSIAWYDDGGTNTSLLLGNGSVAISRTSALRLQMNSDMYYLSSVSADWSFGRIAAGVCGQGTTSAIATWIQNTPGEATLAANFTKANATLGATNISFTVITGRSYRIEGYLILSNSTAGEGAQINFGGTATATTFDLAVIGTNGTNVAGTTVSTTLAGVINYTSLTGTNRIKLSGYFKCLAGGTLILQGAENTTATGTFTMAAGSWIALADTVNL